MSNDADEYDDEPGPDRPKFPVAARIAGIIWIGFGALELVGAMLSLALAGANPGAGGPAGGCCPGLVGIAFLVCGIQTVTGSAKDTLGNGIGSILLGLLQLGVGVLLVVLGAGVVGANQQAKNDPTVIYVIAAIASVLGITLIGTGALALSARTAYREWRRSQKPARRSRRRDDYDGEEEDDRPRRHRRDPEDDDRPRRRGRDELDD